MVDVPKNWMRAFQLLKGVINSSKKRKKVIFLDELSWMATRNSGLVKALEQFWNSYLSARKDVVLVVCASATSWILDHAVRNKGGPHGRLTAEIKANAGQEAGKVEEGRRRIAKIEALKAVDEGVARKIRVLRSGSPRNQKPVPDCAASSRCRRGKMRFVLPRSGWLESFTW